MTYKIVLLAGEWDTTPIVYNFLNNDFPVAKVIMEKPVPRKEFLKKRIKKLGWLTVAGQVLFQVAVAKPLKKSSAGRIAEIKKDYGLEDTEIPAEKLHKVSSVNANDCLQVLKELNPDLVVVHGTRIISKRILQQVSAPFINIHAGITPRYRGSHGAYWALVNKDAEHCGVTVHLVDPGIDTGEVLFQQTIPFTGKDNFSTYSYLQLAVGLRLLKKAIPGTMEGTLQTSKPNLNSALWHHPTLWGYLYKKIRHGVK